MGVLFRAVTCALILGSGVAMIVPGKNACAVAGKTVVQGENTSDRSAPSAMKPEIAALLQKSTAVYTAMKTYRHQSEYLSKGQSPQGDVNQSQTYTLALERPNKFCFKSDDAEGNAAVSNGKTFINHRSDLNDGARSEHSYYTKVTAPASYKGINIVDDVTFPYGTYMVALMLQGDALADKEVKANLEKATLRPGVEENGKKYDVIDAPTPNENGSVQFYFDAATHLLHKTVGVVRTPNFTGKVTEIIENVSVDKPLPPATFEYTPPKNARLIVRNFPEDSTPGTGLRPVFVFVSPAPIVVRNSATRLSLGRCF